MDFWGVYRGEVHVVSFADRSFTTARIREKQELLKGTAPCVFQEAGQTNIADRYSRRCLSADQKQVVYSKGESVKIYDSVTKAVRDLGFGHEASWSPDGKWIGFSDGKHYVLLDSKTGSRTKLFGTKDATTAEWSPDSRYLTYTKTGGSPGQGSLGGLLIWKIQCPEPWRVWVWRVEDGEHDWVMQICKPPRSFLWLNNSDLSF
ncbi:MAG: hypothetical protein ACRD59_02355 [Candidatus Acidiferrales bacterium]